MKPIVAVSVLSAALGGTACSLVTVPVKVAGGIVETTVETTGNVITAPFKAIGGDGKEEKKTKTGQKDAPSSSGPAGDSGGGKPADA
jgi:hypothetical protein